MSKVAFIDTEIDPRTNRILDIGGIREDSATIHSNAISQFKEFIQDSQFICGHNILNHDIVYLELILPREILGKFQFIDTLHLSPLLFPSKPYHALLKDDKLQTEEMNNPLNDAIKAKDLFYDEIAAFRQMDLDLKQILYALLHNQKEFSGFFSYLDYQGPANDVEQLIQKRFHSKLCEQARLDSMVAEKPIELAYALVLINAENRHSLTPSWVLKNYPFVERIMNALRSKPCLTGCTYCDQALNIHAALKSFFGFDTYRKYGGEPLQERAVQAAVHNKSILAVFPTGGGKSITFQVPALMSGRNSRGLTVIISPLQSLMKDQVDNLEKVGITDAVTINGLLDPIERGKSFERVLDGSASILYISPESLRSHTIEKLILSRKIARFVIDEAHCFSSWGQDFRVDYLYIGDFIKSTQEKKNLTQGIPVSCFTATAKQKVIEDIRAYFKEKLDLELEVFRSSASRTNLHYQVFEKADEEEKYNAARDLIDEKNCPTIIYVSRTRRAYFLAERLVKDGYKAKPYHGKMEKQEKSENQDSFINGETQIIVATSAFGMGVDKKDVGLVIHFEISDSLENYIQEAGRAGRDEHITADCYVLFNEEDLAKHFILLNQTKLSIKEIQQVWRAIKEITRFRMTASHSALEIARKAGWDDSIVDIETRVTTAIAALEDAGYLKRGQNMPRVFANSILAKNAQEAIDKINTSEKFQEKQKEKAVRIIKKLFSSKSRRHANDEMAESRVDYISDHLGIVKEEVINIVNLLREERILEDAKDLTAFIKRGEQKNRSLNIVQTFAKIERYLLSRFDIEERGFHLKELNEGAEADGCEGVSPNKIKTLINFWHIKNWIKRQQDYSKNHLIIVCSQSNEVLEDKLDKRHQLARFVVEYLYAKSLDIENSDEKDEILVEFSVNELKDAYTAEGSFFKVDITLDDIEDTLFYLSRIDAIKIEGGFMVVYNRLTLERLEEDNRKKYKLEDYEKLSQFYQSKVQQIHIVGEYAKRMIHDYQDALQFVDDYFQLNNDAFLGKYFKGSRRNEIKMNLTPSKFKQLFGELSPTQLKIVKDDQSKYIVVAAGPGSGKTKLLVHKLASLFYLEDVKHEQLLMLTFSRAAATEFKKRLIQLIGNAALFIDIKTFHSYCFDLMGKVGSIEKSDDIIRKTIEQISSGEVEPSMITKTVMVIDEAQDMDADEFELVRALMEHNDDMRVIAVGDDDQNIYEFRGASAKYLEQFIIEKSASKYELTDNYRSKSNLVEFTNQYARTISHRLKELPIVANQKENGTLKITQYRSGNLILPLVQDVLDFPLHGTTCVLTRTNEEALLITGLLAHHHRQARLIQSNDGFNLTNLYEIRYFLSQLAQDDNSFVIADDIWATAKRNFKEAFQTTSKYEMCMNLIRDFEETNTKKIYRSDFEVFLRESKMEDFYAENGEVIYVSTIHKSKGREFDNVFIMLDNFRPETDPMKRQLYVGMTRAKKVLSIHYNGNYLDKLYAEEMEKSHDENSYSPPDLLTEHLSLKDVNLGYFKFVQPRIRGMKSGDELQLVPEGCLNGKGDQVLKFSHAYQDKLTQLASKGFRPSKAKVDIMVYWKAEDDEEEVVTVLPEIHFERQSKSPNDRPPTT